MRFLPELFSKQNIPYIITGVVIILIILNWIKKRMKSKFITMITPLKGIITSSFGWRVFNGQKQLHNGIDIAAPIGSVVKAPASGTVIRVWTDQLNGNGLRIQHDNGLITAYAHLHKFLVKEGQKIIQGQEIAQVGNTGLSTGAHLHFGIMKNNEWVNPEVYCNFK